MTLVASPRTRNLSLSSARAVPASTRAAAISSATLGFILGFILAFMGETSFVENREFLCILAMLSVGLLEIAQVGRRLVLLGRHKVAVGAEKVVLLTDADVVIAFAANLVGKPERFIAYHASIGLLDHPRPGQRMVDGGDVVAHQVRIGLVEIDALLDDGLIIRMQRNSARIIDARTLHAAGLDFEHVVATITVRIAPFADGIAQISRLQHHVVREVTSIGVDLAMEVPITLKQNVCRNRSYHEFHSLIGNHDARHARREARIGRINALTAFRHIGKIFLVDSLVFRRERWLLFASERLARIEGSAAKLTAHAAGPPPLAIEIGILAVGIGWGAADRHRKP